MPQLSLLGFCKTAEGAEKHHIGPSLDEEQQRMSDISCRPEGYGMHAPPPPARAIDKPDAENDPRGANRASGQSPSDVSAEAMASLCKPGIALCEYEQARRVRIQKNFEKLRSLGLSGGIAEAVGVPAPSQKRKVKRKSEQCPAEWAPVRRSTRSKPNSDENLDGRALEAATCPLRKPSPHEQLPAPWLGPELALQLPSSDSGSADALIKPVSVADEVEGFHAFHCSMSSRDLKAIYSLNWYGHLLLAAGKGGICSLFSVPEVAQEAELDYLACCQLHKSWISDAEMLHPKGLVNSRAHSSGAVMPLVLSASNAGEITLWDPATVDGRGCFSQIAETHGVHKKGIFSMHVCPEGTAGEGCKSNAAGGNILSGSKDASVALTTVNDTGFEVVRKWDELHAGVVKAVRWRDSTLAASSGNDSARSHTKTLRGLHQRRVIRLLDPRMEEPSIAIVDAHNTVINTLSWSSSAAAGSTVPCATMTETANLLLSMSHDPSIHIHDIRRPDKPFAVLCGHTQLRKGKNINQASFCWGGRGVVCGGEGLDNDKLYLYDIKGAIPTMESRDEWQSSQGVRMVAATEVGHNVSTVQLNDGGRFVAAAGGRGNITVSKAVVA